MKKDNKKIVFTKDIDSSINGFALVLAFLLIGVFLQFNANFFAESNRIIKIIFVVVGTLGFFTEVNNLNIKFNIKGIDNIVTGLVLGGIIYFLYVFVDYTTWHIILIVLYEIAFFIIMLLSFFAIFEGLIQMVYSFYLNYNQKEHRKYKIFSSLIVILSQILGLLLIIAQIYSLVFK